MCTQNSTAIPIDIMRFTTETAFSWIPRIAITPCKDLSGILLFNIFFGHVALYLHKITHLDRVKSIIVKEEDIP